MSFFPVSKALQSLTSFSETLKHVAIMPVFTVFALGQSNISISGGEQLSGITQGDGSHLVGETITLNVNAWEPIEVFDSEANFQDSDNSQTLDSAQTFDGVAYAAGLRVEAEYGLTVQDPDGNVFELLGVNINEPGVTSFATVEGLAFVGGVGGFPPIGVPLTVVSNQEGPSQPFASLATPPCFTAGSLIVTPRGLCPVETLRPGDLVQTLDNGLQPLLWSGKAHIPQSVLIEDIRFRPVLVRKDAFGPGQPNRDMHLSQQHRVLVRGWRAELFYGENEILVPIAKLVNDTTILIDHAVRDITYVHLLFGSHEIIWGDGLLSESFLPSALHDSPTQQEILRLFPNCVPSVGDELAARLCIKDKRTSLLI